MPKALVLIAGAVKFLAVAIYIVFYLTVQVGILLLVYPKTRRLKVSLWFVKVMCRLTLATLGIKVTIDETNKAGSFLISNHMSYIDALILFAYFPALFITSVEIKETPVLGQLCQLAGTFFVERRKEKRSPGTVGREIAQIKEKFLDGFKIILFPEGTSSNGQDVLPFKTAMLQIAIEANTPITPLCLSYTMVNGEKFSPQNADAICWYGDMTFPDHLFKLCQQSSVNAHIKTLAPILPENYKDRFELGLNAQRMIRTEYLSTAGLHI